jgi:SAM-dependent methyltransferase
LGIGSDAIEILIKLRASGHLHPRGAVMEIGAQQLSNEFLIRQEKLTRLGSVFGTEKPLALPQPKSSHVVHGDLMHLDQDAPRARDFWRWLGFDYAAIDIDGSPGSIPLDLNYDRAPLHARQKFDLVTNFGTTEHVANQLNAFKLIHDLTKPGGVMMHHLPAQGMLNHGFVNYNLKFFWMLARSNGYSFLHASWSHSGIAYGPSADLLDFFETTEPTAKAPTFKVADAMLTIVMEKSFDIRFVPPIDVQTGSQLENKKLNKRYWTVFDSFAFPLLEAGGIRVGTGPDTGGKMRPTGLLRARTGLAAASAVLYLAAALLPDQSRLMHWSSQFGEAFSSALFNAGIASMLTTSFGTNASSVDLFLLVIAASAVIYLARFRDHRLLLLPATFATLTLTLLTPIAGVRYFGVAAILPAAHVAFEFLDLRWRKTFGLQANPTRTWRFASELALMMLQVCLLVFVCFANGTGIGLFAGVAFAGLAALWLDRHQREQSRQDLAKLGSGAITAALFVAFLVVWMPRIPAILDGAQDQPLPSTQADKTCAGSISLSEDLPRPYAGDRHCAPNGELGAKLDANLNALHRMFEFQNFRSNPAVLMFTLAQAVVLLLFVACGVLIFAKNFMVQWLVFAMLGVFCLPQFTWTSAGTEVSANVVFFEFSIVIFMFAMAVEGFVRLYRPRIIEFMIAHRRNQLSPYRAAE